MLWKRIQKTTGQSGGCPVFYANDIGTDDKGCFDSFHLRTFLMSMLRGRNQQPMYRGEECAPTFGLWFQDTCGCAGLPA